MKGFFPVQAATTLFRIAFLVKEARQRLGIRQIDLADRAQVSLRTVRNIEAAKGEAVSLHDFMMVLFIVGVSDRVFQALREDPTLAVTSLSEHRAKRVRLARTRPEDF